MKTIKQGGLYRYYKNDQDWAVVMAGLSSKSLTFEGQVLSCSKNTSAISGTGVKAQIGAYSSYWAISDFTYLPNCELSFVCKPKNPKKEKELVVEGEYYFETNKGKKR